MIDTLSRAASALLPARTALAFAEGGGLWTDVPLFPESASTTAGRVDALYFYLIGITIFFSTAIFLCLFVFAVKYRRRSESERPKRIAERIGVEVFWTAVPLAIALSIFGWGTKLYIDESLPPADALDVYVVGRQWMWQVQHSEGRREINELHVPMGRPVKLTMTSEDVIHSFYVPAFRVKRDAVPGRYSTEWFQATKPGRYHLFCAEYCGTKHSAMIGWVTVMTPADYQRWLTSGTELPVGAEGERLFGRLACGTCHGPESTDRGPALAGLFGSVRRLQNGRSVIADESYIRESILDPNAKLLAGYPAVMPTYRGQISEPELLLILAYLKSLDVETLAGGAPK